MADIQTPWTSVPVPTPDTGGFLGGTKGGADLPDAPKETPNSVTGIGLQPTLIDVPDAPGGGAHINVPDLTGRNPGTIDQR